MPKSGLVLGQIVIHATHMLNKCCNWKQPKINSGLLGYKLKALEIRKHFEIIDLKVIFL